MFSPLKYSRELTIEYRLLLIEVAIYSRTQAVKVCAFKLFSIQGYSRLECIVYRYILPLRKGGKKQPTNTFLTIALVGVLGAWLDSCVDEFLIRIFKTI